MFKGTATRSARDIAESVDAVGGEMNAFTSREHTAYYTRLPADELGFGLDLLCDVLSEPALRGPEIDAEREVILEELALSEDTPDDKVHSLLADAVFPDHPLGREVLGDANTVAALGRDEIAGFFRERYRPANVVIAAAGRLEHDDVVDGVKAFLEGIDSGHAPAAPARPHPCRSRSSCTIARPSRRTWRSAGGPSSKGTTIGSRWRSRTRCSVAGCPAGSSRRSERSAAWRTACTRVRRCTPTRDC